MLTASSDVWEEHYQHPFIQGLKDGSLADEKFKHYLIQDILYLNEYSSAFLIGAAKAEDTELISFLAQRGNAMVSGPEDEDVNKRNLKRLGYNLDQIEQESISLDNLAYVSYMIRVAYEGGTAEALAAVMPCGLSYEYLAKRMVEENPECADHEKYGDFIRNYTKESFCENNAKMVSYINELSENYSEKRKERLIEIFVKSSEFETRFWDLSWNLS